MNVSGSFLLAAFAFWMAERFAMPEHMRLLVATGFLGGFTTFSTYATEGAAMLRSGDYFNGLAYILLTNALCLLAAVFGMWLANN